MNAPFKLFLLLTILSFSLLSCDKNMSKDAPLPFVKTPSVYIGSQNAVLYALDPQTGEKRWEFNAGGNIQGSPCVYNDWVFVISELGQII